MRYKIKAFTLIEVIMATSILSITVFGIYKLIGENSKTLNIINNHSQISVLSQNIEQCIENIGYDMFFTNPNSHYNFHLGVDGLGCGTGSTIITKINEMSYEISGEILSKNIEKTHWRISILSEYTGNIQHDFTHYK